MKRIVLSDAIMCMSNVRGNKIVIDGPQPFSFYFSGKNSPHSIRVNPIFNPEKMSISKAGTLKLSDDWKYIPGKDDKSVSDHEIESMKAFFRKYLVLFCAVWDEQLDDPSLQDYFQGDISFHKLLTNLEFYSTHSAQLLKLNNVTELENFCRKEHLVNLYGN